MDREPHLYATDRYEDVSDALKAETSSLKPGELSESPGFKLYAAINAFEIGNPRMDTGANFIPLEKQLTCVPSVETESDCHSLLNMLVELEMSWHAGHSPLQTLFACPLVEKEAMAVDLDDFEIHSWADVARAYIVTTIRSLELCFELAEQAYTVIFPEEDLHVVRYDYGMIMKTHPAVFTHLIEKSQKFASNQGSHAIQELLALRLGWYNIVKQRVPKKFVHVDRCLQALDRLVEAKDPEKFYANFGFSEAVQSRAPNACVGHKLKRMSLDEAREQWRGILRGIRDFEPAYHITRSADLLGFYLVFSSKRQLPIVRAVARNLISSQGDLLGTNARIWAAKDIMETSLPTLDVKNKVYDTFLGQAALCYVDLLTCFSQNRCRFRESLKIAVISFDSLQVSAAQTDQIAAEHGLGKKLGQLPAMELSAWVYFRKLQIMMWIVLLSFETDILQPDEYGYSYWYALQLSQRLVEQLGRLRTYFEHLGHRSTPGYTYLSALELEAQTLLQMCTALYSVYAALEKLGAIRSVVQTPLSSREMRYALRFAAFESVGVPEQAKYSEYNKVTDQLSPDLCFKLADNAAKGARSLLSTLAKIAQPSEELNLIRRSAAGLGIAIATLQSGNVQSIRIRRDGYHWYFPIPERIS